MNDDKRILKINKDGQEIEVYLKQPSLDEREKGEAMRLKAWNQAIKEGAFFYESLNKILREQGLWDEEKEDKIIELQRELLDNIAILKRGGIKLSQARQIAIRIRQIRIELALTASIRQKYVNETVEGIAQNKEFNYFVSCVAVYSNDRNKKYFASYEDFLNRITDDDAYTISRRYAEITYSFGDEKQYPENDFLLKYKFCDDRLRLTDKDGNLVDVDGRRISESGNYIKTVDGKEIEVDENGNPVGGVNEPQTFIDDLIEVVEEAVVA